MTLVNARAGAELVKLFLEASGLWSASPPVRYAGVVTSDPGARTLVIDRALW